MPAAARAPPAGTPPTRRLAGFYFLLFATVGVYMPWVPPLLAERGFSARAIGIVLALGAVLRAVLPPVWGIVADRTASPRRLLALTTTFSGLALLLLAVPGSVLPVVLGLLAYGLFQVPVLPLVEAMTLGMLREGRTRYGRVRLWGSVGFVAASLGVGWLVRGLGVWVVPFAAGAPLVLAGLLARGLSEPVAAGPAPLPIPTRASLAVLPWRALVPVLAAAALGQGSHGAYYAFFSLQLAARGASPPTIGAFWTVGVLAEVVLMAASPRLFARLRLTSAVRLALALAILRWAVLALEPSLGVVAAVQVLHAASYALLHLATLQLVDLLTPARHKVLGQSLLSATAYGMGVSGGLALAGRLAPDVGALGLYGGAAALATLGLVAATMIRDPREPQVPAATPPAARLRARGDRGR